MNLDFKNTKLKTSRYLISKEDNGKTRLFHYLNRNSIEANETVIGILDSFRIPEYVDTVHDRVYLRDFRKTTELLVKLKFIIPAELDEEYRHLEQNFSLESKKRFESSFFILLYPEDQKENYAEFICFIHKVYESVIAHSFFKRATESKFIIFLCDDRNEFKRFWGDVDLPSWVDTFVYHRKILVIDSGTFDLKNLDHPMLFRIMAHEISHLVIGSLNWNLPVWLEEGICEYISRGGLKKGHRRLTDEKSVFGLKELNYLAHHSLLDLDKANPGNNLGYIQSHCFFSYLVDRFGEEPLFSCLENVGLKKDINRQLERSFGKSLDLLEKSWLNRYQLKHKPLVLSKYFRIIRKGEDLFIYNSFYGGYLKSNRAILRLLKAWKEPQCCNAILDTFEIAGFGRIVKILFDLKILVFAPEKEQPCHYIPDQQIIENGGLINELRLNVSLNCNMTCSYCYIEKETQKRRMSWEVAEKSLHSYFSILRKNDKAQAVIRFFGGEPLINWRLIKRVFDYVNGIRGAIDVSYILNTNGAYVTEEIAKALFRENTLILISLDGIGKVHDTNRRLKTGEGSFKRIEQNLDVYLKHGAISIETTLTNRNIDHLDELIDFLAEKKTQWNRKIRLGLQNLSVVDQFSKTPFSLSDAYRVKKITEAFHHAQKKGIGFDAGMINLPFNSMVNHKKTGRYCSGLGSELSIKPDGDINPCGAIDLKLGNVNHFNETIFTTDNYQSLCRRVTGALSSCAGCEIEAFCSGGCAADSWSKRKDIYQPTVNCSFEKLLFKTMVKEFFM